MEIIAQKVICEGKQKVIDEFATEFDTETCLQNDNK